MTSMQKPEGTQDTGNSPSNGGDKSVARRNPLYGDIARGAVLGLMAALIYFIIASPLRHTQQNARRSSCQSNLKQIGMAYKQYITDWDELYPPIYTDNDRSGSFDSAHDQGWAQNIQPYFKNVKALQCPSEANRANLAGGLQTGYTDYFMNGLLASMSESKFTHISNTILLGDHSS
ncbi:MAG TPA: DUF1559 domain-containing protein, partial [Abditibacteriaceae bacterium]|nr:DUF1559 domain-containing protein [Abditibacteriaceae bacterium]